MRNTKLSLIFVRIEHGCAAAAQLFWGGKHRSWVITWQRFGKAYWFHLPPLKTDWQTVPKRL